MQIGKTGRTLAVATLSLGLILSVAAPTTAQNTQENQVKTDWSEEKLENFGEAAVALQDIQAEWKQRIANARTEEKRQTLRQQQADAMDQAIRDAGLTPKEYSQIVRAVRNDQEFYQEVSEYVEDAKSE